MRYRMARKEQFWSADEEKLLKKLYRSSICPDELLKKFPGRSWSSLLHKACKLKLKKGKYIPKIRKSRKWTESEIDVVKMFYGQIPDENVQAFIPHRSISAIKKIAIKYKPRNRKKKNYFQNPSWTKLENALLLENYQKMTNDELSKIIPNRTYDAIRAHIRVLELERNKDYLKRAQSGFRWTNEELQILSENKQKSVNNLKELLPERSCDSIRGQLKRI